MSDDVKKNVIEHFHHQAEEKSYEKQVALTGLNVSVFICSNDRKDTLKRMTDLGLSTMKKVKNLEDNK